MNRISIFVTIFCNSFFSLSFGRKNCYTIVILHKGGAAHEQGNRTGSADMKITKAEAKEKALDLFDKLNFAEGKRIWDSYSFELSGGMNQRVGIALSMLMNPSVLMADEPTSALDVSVQKQAVMEMLRLRELFGTAIILVTHDIGVVSAMADRILVLQDGNMIEYGDARKVLQDPQNAYTKKLLGAVPRLRRG